jgi:hypothetical protein
MIVFNPESLALQAKEGKVKRLILNKVCLIVIFVSFVLPIVNGWAQDCERKGNYHQRGQVAGLDQGKQIPISTWGGQLPFAPSPLKVDGELTGNYSIKITAQEKGCLIPTEDSAVPVRMPSRKFYTHAVNVTWEFVKPGIAFETEGTNYVSEKAGATISFTEAGVKMDGIKTTPISLK